MGDAPILRLPATGPTDGPGWAELHVHTAFSFLQGCAQPDELVAEAARLGITVLAVTDRDGLYAARRLAEAAGPAGIGTVYGAELTLGDPDLGTPVILARTLEGFRSLAAAISTAQLAGTKNAPVYDLDALSRTAAAGHWAVLPGCPRPGTERRDVTTAAHRLRRLVGVFGTAVHAELTDHHLPEDADANDALFVAARRAGVPVVATGAVHYPAPRHARLAQALTALRRREPLPRAAGHLMPAPTAHLRSHQEMTRWLARYPGVAETTLDLGRTCVIDLSLLHPELPGFPTPEGHDEDSWLRRLAEDACTTRYGRREDPHAAAAWRQLGHELDVITGLGMSGYFLIVHDIVRHAAEQGIWVQGRGSAASSVVCHVLGITAVDSLKYGLLFERFLSLEKAGPPDIDLDIEAGRREEVIQYVYTRYGREHAAQVANVITYQPRLAVRDAARALGHLAPQIREMTRHIHHHTPPGADIPLPADVRDLASQLHGLPRHLGVHSGGMVLTRRPIGETMPVEWATAEGRSVLQGDKDDVAAAGLIKIDLLGLGMLSALHTACDLIHQHHGIRLDLASIPQDDPDVYRMIARADTIGVFQVESRAQISTLPQLRPTTFDDLAVAASIIRPGPIQAGSKHPYLRRRRGEEPVTYPHPLAEPALKATLGVPLWQEQAMQLAIDCAGFTPGDADRLRKAMAAKRGPEHIARLRGRLLHGMADNGIPPAAADRIVSMIESFSDYGFPQSHAQSMAGIIYASAWIKHHHPAALLAAIMNHLPMGFYDVQTLIQDARHYGIPVHPVDIEVSDVHATLEPGPKEGKPAIRRGLTSVTGLSPDTARTIVDTRTEHPFTDLEDVARRTRLSPRLMERLAAAGAFDRYGDHRRTALWTAGAFPRTHQPYLPGTATLTPPPHLAPMTPAEETAADLATTSAGTTHPVHHIRPHLQQHGAQTTATALGLTDQTPVRLGGLAKYLQRPPTANGMAFGVLEDETAMINLVLTPPVWDRYGRTLLEAPAVLLEGHVERAYDAINVLVHRVEELPSS
ncbi:error-prone DNA polymerase [Streptomyces acidiscabies]|uniref:error-prone DNA polymerase n=1 Tax=Streptomyces acidiscabies TaxID=42234 RepID=UPI0029AF815D|nr:error-prone DNA polymerase [Streptomyces acidiscabies]MDX3797100.1 error-prone DNA polymerase [Streptomyces acidiscabies]